MKKIFFVFLLLLSFGLVVAQSYKYDFRLGVGASVLGTAGHLLLNKQYVDYSITPEYEGHFRVFAGNNVAIGLALGYQRFALSGNIDTLRGTLSAAKWNLGLSATLFYLQKKGFNLFTGARAGVSIWHYRAQANFDYYVDKYFGAFAPVVSKYLPNDGSYTNTLLSLQITLLGMSVYPVKNLGLYGELALGSPYWFNFGLSYRFNSSRVKKVIGY